MGLRVKLYQSLFLLTLGVAVTGCAVTSGLQTYDLPVEGMYQTELGSHVNVVKISQNTLPAIQPAQINIRQEYAHLFNTRPQTYTLKSGDVLSIHLWAHPEISNAQDGYSIDGSGYIQFPVVGRYKASGKSVQQINNELNAQLSRYLKKPDAVVRVLSYQGQHYSVQGKVVKSGQFALSDQPTSVYTAIGAAGGIDLTQGANTSLTLIRQGRSYELNPIELEKAGYSLHHLWLRANDTLFVNSRENQKIYVMGEATSNKSIQLRDQGMSLTDVLGESFGINPMSGSRSKIYVVRSHPYDATTEVYHLDLTSIGDFGLASKFAMRSNDIVYIDVAGLARWQRIINQLLPFSTAINGVTTVGE